MSSLISPSTLDFVRDIRAEQLRRKRAERNAGFGANIPNSVADCQVQPDPQWETDLRACNPISEHFTHLRFYWYRAGARWVLYDCLPAHLIRDDETKYGPTMTGQELLAAFNGPPPRMLEDWQQVGISDMQHEMYRLHKVFALPFWVLQGDKGGHQVAYSPWEQNLLIAKGLPAEPPKIGSLDPCPFDQRVIAQLNQRNRRIKLGERLMKMSGTKEFADAEMEVLQREIREAEMAFVESQMQPIADMAMSLVAGSNTRSEHADQIVRVPDGTAAKAADAYQQYKETGEYTFKPGMIGT